MGLRTLLGTEPRIEIVGEAGTVAAAVETCLHVKPAVVLLDIRLPDGTGFDACRQILAKLPDTRVLVLTSVADETLVDEAIRAGANYLVIGRPIMDAADPAAAAQAILAECVTAVEQRT